MKKRIAIIGHGYVGKAVEYGFSNKKNKIQLIDPHLYNNTVTDIEDPTVSFVCVPTPMNIDGSINSSIVEDVTEQLMTLTSGLIVIKSTVIPSVVKRLSDKNHRVIYNPEFLTERNALIDFVNPPMHVFGGHENNIEELHKFYTTNSQCKPAPIFKMSAAEAAFVKYGINSFLATKVLWFNQYKDMIDDFGADFDSITNAIGSDPRIGQSHAQVPGPDGRNGFGGACFTKDTSALIGFDHCNFLSVLKLVVEENKIYRNQYKLDSREKEQNVNYK
jgi:UDPglucose 6-dehydrogenase